MAAVCALVAALVAAPAAHGRTATALTTVTPTPAGAAANLDVFTLAGAPQPNRISAYLDATGRLVVISPEGIMAPSSPGNECRQEGASQVSCAPGFIDAIAGDLGAGPDSFSADPSLTVAIGLNLPGPSDRPLHGADGRDRLVGGAADDLILGGRGPDSLMGEDGTDILRGEAGADEVFGGGAPDLVSGGAGSDRLKGGSGRDRCIGGGGIDRASGCAESRGVP